MTARLIRAATSNAFSTTLNGSLNDSVTTITLTSVTGLQAPGVTVIDREDGSGTATPTKREFVSYTGISGSDLTGVTRGVAGSTAQSHSSGALVEETMSVTHWNDLYDFLTAEHTLAGLHIISTATITTHLMASGASITSSDIRILRSLNVSGASLTGPFPLNPAWFLIGSFSGPTTQILPALPMPQAGGFDYINVLTRTVASGASAIIDINKNGTSIFDAGTRPSIAGGGTFVSTASIATKGFAIGDRLTVDYDTTGGLITDFMVSGRAR